MVNRIAIALRKIFFSLILVIALFCTQSPAVFAQTQSTTMIASLFSFSGKRPNTLGVKNGKLAPCPNSPNCVSSQASDTDSEHKIEPLRYESSAEEAFAKLQGIIEDLDNAKIIKVEDNYLYAEFSTKLMGFVDDVEFYLDSQTNAIQVRSASRLGESDLGVNRKRIEDIRGKFNT